MDVGGIEEPRTPSQHSCHIGPKTGNERGGDEEGQERAERTKECKEAISDRLPL